MEKFFFIASTLALMLAGQFILKARALAIGDGDHGSRAQFVLTMFSDLWVWASLGAAVVASVCWMLALRIAPLSVAYPFMALSFVLTPLGAVYFFAEPVSIMQWIGAGLIVSGIVVGALGA